MKRLNALNNTRAVTARDHLAFLSRNIERVSGEINRMVSATAPLLEAAEASIISDTTKSIRDEVNYSTVFDSNESVSTTTLTLNTVEQMMTIPMIYVDDIPYVGLNTDALEINQQPLVLRKGTNVRLETSDLFTSGYYFGRFLDNNPVFRSAPNLATLEESVDENFYVETYEDGALQIRLRFTFLEPEEIGGIMIDMGRCSGTPVIEKVEVLGREDTEVRDITPLVTSQGINLRGVDSQPNNRAIRSGKGGKQARTEITINQNNIRQLFITLRVEAARPVEYTEYEQVDPQDNVIRNFNFFESLYLGGFEFNDAFTVAQAGIDTQELEQARASDTIRRAMRTINKKFLTIKRVQFKTIQITGSGEYVSRPFGRGNEIHSVEVVTNELIPPRLDPESIKYFIVTEQNLEFEVHPTNKANPSSKKTRIVLEPGADDAEQVESQGSIRLKVVMSTSGVRDIPRLYGYIMRVKETFGV